jgi:hypothetical protein
LTPPGRSGPPRRRATRDAVRRELLVFVEGEETEERYLTDWAQRCRRRTLVTIDRFHGRPLQLVEEAVARRRAGAREARRAQGRPYDEIWCVFDVDDHPNFAQAVDLARRNGVGVAVSNPCIELWFILHFEDQTAFINRTDAQRRAADLLGCGKALTAVALDVLAAHCDYAIARARGLDGKHAGDGSPPGANPSSGVYQLIEVIREGDAARGDRHA